MRLGHHYWIHAEGALVYLVSDSAVKRSQLMKKLRCCPVCYENVHLEAEGTRQTGGKLEINYKIICPFCKLGFYKTGSVVMSYDEEAMQPEVKDSNLKNFIYDWNSILRDPERERIANI